MLIDLDKMERATIKRACALALIEVQRKIARSKRNIARGGFSKHRPAELAMEGADYAQLIDKLKKVIEPAAKDPTCVLCETGEEPGHEH